MVAVPLMVFTVAKPVVVITPPMVPVNAVMVFVLPYKLIALVLTSGLMVTDKAEVVDAANGYTTGK